MPVGTTPRLLVVDNEDTVRHFASRVLRDSGYDVVDVSSGAEALRVLAREQHFDGYVVDLMMPEMRGDVLAREVRRVEPDAKVLYMTGYSDQLFKEKMTLWEGEAFLEKPVTMNGLLEAVSLLLFGHTRGPAR